MPANKYALIRYHVIDRMIRNPYRRFPSLEEMVDECSEVLGKPVSRSSIEKDLYAMKNDGGLNYSAPIRFDKHHGGYYYEDEGYSINKIPLSEDEIDAVQFAANLLNQFTEVPILKKYDAAVSKIMSQLNVARYKDLPVDRIIQFESHPTIGGNEFLSDLIYAIGHSLHIEFTYRSFAIGAQEKRRVASPYLLKEYKSRWYLIAQEEKQYMYKIFGLERISELQVKEEKFTPKKDFSPDAYFKYSIGITADQSAEPQKVVFECNEILSKYLTSQPIHSSQRIKSGKDKTLVELKVIITYELIEMLLGFGEDVKVLQPVSLRNDLIDKLNRTLQQYHGE
ncbi:MAG TPA: hypothetical protein DDX92_03040 [Flavobacteriales bacterium]|jgi:predicted DNA-binding transcriptional regulator YafY|nr:hypothetical protein [Flavobacteriales bacterium]